MKGLRDPRWAILLDLYVSGAAGRSVSVGDACVASGVPTTTALRYLSKLIAEGRILRIDDHLDRRRAHMRLTADTEAAISKLIDRVADSD